MLNNWTGIGNLTRDPEAKQLPSGSNVTTLRIAVNRRKGKDREDRGAVYVNIEVWGKLGENCAKSLRSGSKVGVQARLEHTEWETENPDGTTTKHERHYLVANEVEFLSPRPAAVTEAAAPAAA